MRAIGTLSAPDDATRFSDYLLALGISSRVDAADGDHVIWVHDEERVQQASNELAVFRQNPQDAKYVEASRQAEELRRAEAAKQARARSSTSAESPNPYQSPMTGSGRRRRIRVPVTFALLLLSFAVAAMTGLGTIVQPWIPRLLISGESPDLQWDFPGLPEIRGGQVWRLVTPAFLHFSPLHLLFNSFMLLQLGVLVESRRGSLRFAGIVLAIAVVSNLSQYWWNGPAFGGMSGVVFGLFGYAWMKSQYAPRLGMNVTPGFVVVMLIFLVLATTNLFGNIANAAHIAGLLTGMAIGVAPHLPEIVQRRT